MEKIPEQKEFNFGESETQKSETVGINVEKKTGCDYCNQEYNSKRGGCNFCANERKNFQKQKFENEKRNLH